MAFFVFLVSLSGSQWSLVAFSGSVVLGGSLWFFSFLAVLSGSQWSLVVLSGF